MNIKVTAFTVSKQLYYTEESEKRNVHAKGG